MIQNLIEFLNASPVNFLAVKTVKERLMEAGFREIDAAKPIGNVVTGDRLFFTKKRLFDLCRADRKGKTCRQWLPSYLCSLRLSNVPHQAECRDALRGRNNETEHRGVWRSDNEHLV